MVVFIDDHYRTGMRGGARGYWLFISDNRPDNDVATQNEQSTEEHFAEHCLGQDLADFLAEHHS